MTDPQSLIAARMRNVKPSFVREILKVAEQPHIISFAGGLPAPELFDFEGIQLAADEALSKDRVGALQYGVTEGFIGLREELAKLTEGRGAPTDPQRVIVTTGSQQGIDLLVRSVFDPGDVVLLEEPTYLAALQVFDLAQAEKVGVEADDQGLEPAALEKRVQELIAQGRTPKLLYVVSNFANPTGATLPRERRKAILELAVKYGFLVVEDDPYGEIRFRGESVAPFHGVAAEVPGASDLVVYLSTLSKTMAPGLRIGWMVLPEWLQKAVAVVKQASDLHASTFAQRVAYRYLQSGRMAAHLPRIRAAYGERMDIMLDELQRQLPGVIEVERPEGGMFLWGRMSEGVDTLALVREAEKAGVLFVPGTVFSPSGAQRNKLRLSFVTNTREQIQEGVRRLASVVMD